MNIPVFLPVTREFGLRDEFAQDCLLQRGVREPPVPQEIIDCGIGYLFATRKPIKLSPPARAPHR
jgi:hypothetical protein